MPTNMNKSSRMKKTSSGDEAAGTDLRELETHSARKLVWTMYGDNASTVRPPIIALCLRDGWKIGGVKEKYLRMADGGDMAAGP